MRELFASFREGLGAGFAGKIGLIDEMVHILAQPEHLF
jgi:hypothetical protein